MFCRRPVAHKLTTLVGTHKGVTVNLQHYFDVSQAADVETLRARLVQFAEHLGFGLMTAAMVIDADSNKDAPVFHVVSNMPEAFAAQSADPDQSRRDPVNRRLRTLSVPFLYDQALYTAEGAGDLWEGQAPFGYKNGVAVALHMTGHRHFLLGVDRDARLPRAEAKVVRLMADLQLLAVHAQAAATRLLTPDLLPPPSVRLTPREVEVLQWTRAGKSAWDTAVLIGISEATVNFHVRNLCAKLDVASKHQAVLRALQFGWIS